MSLDAFERAVRFAAEAHSGARRKLGGAPYLLHPLEAAVIAGTLTHDPEVLAAATLHDVVEDAGVTPEEIEREFGPRVAKLVASETEDKRPAQPPEATWRLRKEETLARLRASNDVAVQILWLSDKLSNLRSIHARWQQVGDEVWRSFHQRDPAQHAWYYRSVRDALPDLRESAAWREFASLIDEVFSSVPEEDQ